MELNYTPPPSLAPLFINPLFYNLLVGPIGSTKTTACIMFILLQALRQTPGADGVARTRYAISRNTLVQLKMSVLRDILHVFGPIITWRASENLLLLDLPATPATPTHPARPKIFSEWFLIPLEDTNDQQRLLSTQFSGIYLNEVREIDFDIVTAAGGRVGRWPREADGGCTFPFILMDTNPPAKMSELWKFYTLDPPQNLLYIRQPGAYHPDADWLQYLRPDYYDNLITGRSEQWVKVHVHGEDGDDPSGQAVFGHCFERGIHAKKRVGPIPGLPILIGTDPGLNPAAVFGQVDHEGAARAFHEAYAVGMGTTQFIRDHIRPILADPTLQGRPVIVIMDPAGIQRSPNATETAFGIWRKHGFDVRLAGTNQIAPRINVVERHLVERTRSDLPRLLIDPVSCPVLVQSLGGEYRYRKITGRHAANHGMIDPTPLKSHPWSDVVDSLGYFLLGSGLPNALTPRLSVVERSRPPSALAWT